MTYTQAVIEACRAAIDSQCERYVLENLDEQGFSTGSYFVHDSAERERASCVYMAEVCAESAIIAEIQS